MVRTATGPNTEPGGSERLEPGGWDVSEFAGKSAHLVVVDDATGGWGHLNLDQIVLTDTAPPVAPKLTKNATRETRRGEALAALSGEDRREETRRDRDRGRARLSGASTSNSQMTMPTGGRRST